MELYLQNPAGQLSGLADTVADEIAFDLINQGMAEGLIQKRVEEVATQMGLIEQLNLRPEPFRWSDPAVGNCQRRL